MGIRIRIFFQTLDKFVKTPSPINLAPGCLRAAYWAVWFLLMLECMCVDSFVTCVPSNVSGPHSTDYYIM